MKKKTKTIPRVKSSELELIRFFEVSRDLMCIAGNDGYFKRVNPAFISALGYTEKELLERPYSDFVHADDRLSTHTEAAIIKDSAGSESFENRYVCKNGKIRYFAWRSTRVGNQIYAIAHDITEIRERENQERIDHELTLRDAQESFRYLAEAIPQIVWKSDADGKGTYVNQRWFDYTGISKEEMQEGGAWEKVAHPEDFKKSMDLWKKCMMTGDPFETEYRILNVHDNIYRWHLARAVPVCDKDGKILKWFGTLTDIDAQKRIEEELRRSFVELQKTSRERARLIVSEKAALESSRLKSEFLATMSHEIRTPLNGVVGMANLLLRELSVGGKAKELAEIIVYSAESLTGIVNNILDFSKIEAGKMEIEAAEFDIVKVIHRVISAMRFTAMGKGITLTERIDSDSFPLLRGDSVRIQQVLFNLVQNAVKFTDQGSVNVSVELKSSGSKGKVKAKFEVLDTGIGMSASTRAAIFEPFVQADASITRKYGGTGLGLSICKSLIELMGGKIGIESKLEKGTRIWFEVLFDQVEEQKSKQQLPLEFAVPKTGKILVAEDHPTNQKVIRYILENAGMQVDSVDSGRSAISAFERN